MKLSSATIFTILYSSSSSIANARLQSVRQLRPTPRNVDNPGGICTRDSDCQAILRSRSPETNQMIGVDVCDCYGTSRLNPFDECQGESSPPCSIAGCQYNSCEGYEAYCQRESDGSGVCDIRPLQNVDNPGGTCTRDSDCHATLRTQAPSNTLPVGPAMCDCYGASHQLPFDECQGERNCPIAGCQYDQCEGSEAFCQRASDGSGVCALRPIQNVDTPGGSCSDDSDCYTKVRSQVPPNPTGPRLCECYGASHQLPFDECQGNHHSCATARCAEDDCAVFEAWCERLSDGMGECALRINHHKSLTVM